MLLLFIFLSANVYGQLTGTGLDLIESQSSGWFDQIRFRDGSGGPIRHIITDHGGRDRLVIYPGYSGGATSAVEIAGKVAIRTTNIPTTMGGIVDISGYNLFVAGGILTEEVLVSTGWADYVFRPDYNLLPIKEVKNFIKTYEHLPNMPSAKEVESDGLKLKEMTVKQQEKIEELFLYIIQLEEKISAMEVQLKDLQKASEKED